MHRPDKLIPVVLFVILAPLDCRSQPPAQPPPGDVFQSGGCDNDARHYIKNGTIDRCASERAHYACDPLTAQYGMPDHVPISRVNQYERCGGDSCAPELMTCWGWKDRPGPDKPPGDVLQSSAPINCQQSGANEMTCDLRPLQAYPAICFANNGATLICYEPLTGGVQTNQPGEGPGKYTPYTQNPLFPSSYTPRPVRLTGRTNQGRGTGSPNRGRLNGGRKRTGPITADARYDLD
jgi:hypothetical protein